MLSLLCIRDLAKILYVPSKVAFFWKMGSLMCYKSQTVLHKSMRSPKPVGSERISICAIGIYY
jgi:hypothetical protein